MSKSSVFAFVFAGLAAAVAPSYASPIYEIDFTGTLTSGTARDFNLNTNASEAFADLTGLTVSGSMFFDLGAAPSPTVSVDSNGFTNTKIQSAGSPIFVSEILTINGLTVPSNFLPMPTTFNLPPVPSLPTGSTVTQNQDLQLLNFSTKPIAAPQSVLSEMNLMNSWTGPHISGSDTIALDLLISSLQPFFAVPPSGNLPPSWGPVTTGQNGVFTFSELMQDSTIPEHFGLTTDYSVTGQFTLDSASGFPVPISATPEPRTLTLTATALLMLGAVAARSRCRT